MFFGNHAKPSSRNPFLLITIQNPRVGSILPSEPFRQGNCDSANASFSIDSEYGHKPLFPKSPQLLSFLTLPGTCKNNGGWRHAELKNSASFLCAFVLTLFPGLVGLKPPSHCIRLHSVEQSLLLLGPSPGKHFRSIRCLRFESGQRAQPQG